MKYEKFYNLFNSDKFYVKINSNKDWIKVQEIALKNNIGWISSGLGIWRPDIIKGTIYFGLTLGGNIVIMAIGHPAGNSIFITPEEFYRAFNEKLQLELEF